MKLKGDIFQLNNVICHISAPSSTADIKLELLTFRANVYKTVSRKWNAVFQMRSSLILFIKPGLTTLKCLNGNLVDQCVGAGACTAGRDLMKLVIKGTPMPTPTAHPCS
ncbi:hypothetical protein GOODEAATRI_002489 [Goodea atripinnis]|uniref:Uncharacterized protein n=1 Tax=Goodea atripinnis TaxID=208336 RepID=A0ABV0MNQ9_9TELE